MAFGSVGSRFYPDECFPENECHESSSYSCWYVWYPSTEELAIFACFLPFLKNEHNLFWFVSWTKGYISISSYLEIKVKKSSSKCLRDYMKKREVVSSPIFGVLTEASLWRAGWAVGDVYTVSNTAPFLRECPMSPAWHFLVCVQCSDWLNPIQSFSSPTRSCLSVQQTISRLRKKKTVIKSCIVKLCPLCLQQFFTKPGTVKGLQRRWLI